MSQFSKDKIYDLEESTVKRFVKRTKKYLKMVGQNKMTREKLNASVASWTAYAKFGNSWGLRKNHTLEIKRLMC